MFRKTMPWKDAKDKSEARRKIEEEQIKFYSKVANYVKNHPEFVQELELRIEEEENPVKDLSYFMRKGFNNLSEEDIAQVSGEISGIVFKKDKPNRSVFEKVSEDYFTKLISGYMGEYLKKK
jgi:hypothetical protein